MARMNPGYGDSVINTFRATVSATPIPRPVPPRDYMF